MLARCSPWAILIGSILPCSVAAISLAQEAESGQAIRPASKAVSEIDVFERLSAEQARKDISQFRKLIDEQWVLARVGRIAEVSGQEWGG